MLLRVLCSETPRAHRSAGAPQAHVRDADKILVVQNGQIVESGTHDELMALAGSYRLLVDTQLL